MTRECSDCLSKVNKVRLLVGNRMSKMHGIDKLPVMSTYWPLSVLLVKSALSLKVWLLTSQHQNGPLTKSPECMLFMMMLKVAYHVDPVAATGTCAVLVVGGERWLMLVHVYFTDSLLEFRTCMLLEPMTERSHSALMLLARVAPLLELFQKDKHPIPQKTSVCCWELVPCFVRCN